MNTTPTTRFLQRLPLLITFFFSITLVNGFRVFADTFSWSTGPTFSVFDLAQLLTAISFVSTLFWIVMAWLGYSLLIERHPYTLDFARFFFDVIRFSLMFALLNFAFLAGRAGSYHIFILTVAIFHLMMLGWYRQQLRTTHEARQQREWRANARSHGLRVLTYGALGLVYYVGVTLRPGGAFVDLLHAVVVLVTCLALALWNVRRLAELKAYALEAAGEGASAPAQPRPAPAHERVAPREV